jgi:hypothetical protein
VALLLFSAPTNHTYLCRIAYLSRTTAITSPQANPLINLATPRKIWHAGCLF